MTPITSRRVFLSVAALSGLAGCGNVPNQQATTVGPGATGSVTEASTHYTEAGGAASKLFVTNSSVWAFWCDFQGDAVIRRHDANGTRADFPVKDVAGTDLTAQFARTTDGAVWASLNYSLTRIADGRASTQHFDRDVTGQLRGRRTGRQRCPALGSAGWPTPAPTCFSLDSMCPSCRS